MRELLLDCAGREAGGALGYVRMLFNDNDLQGPPQRSPAPWQGRKCKERADPGLQINLSFRPIFRKAASA
jgi:hypothetical protein